VNDDEVRDMVARVITNEINLAIGTPVRLGMSGLNRLHRMLRPVARRAATLQLGSAPRLIFTTPAASTLTASATPEPSLPTRRAVRSLASR
jgi:hypothetical protein